jgi:hypothetical protein
MFKSILTALQGKKLVLLLSERRRYKRTNLRNQMIRQIPSLKLIVSDNGLTHLMTGTDVVAEAYRKDDPEAAARCLDKGMYS